MECDDYFSWLHISDFHAGMKGSNNKWGQVKEKFHRDVLRHIEKNGHIDLVIFSGDLTQQGRVDEYGNVIGELVELWQVFESAGNCPKLLIVPGNHDLTRPSAGEPIFVAVNDYGSDVESQIFKNPNSFYVQNLNQCFSGYIDFVAELKNTKIPLALEHAGALPGEGSGVLYKGARRVGLVGLNSAWSHLKGGNLKTAIHISAEQVHLAVPRLIDEWVKENCVNLLVTHHPADWFTETSGKVFTNEINPLHRFSAHLFGHMHESITKLEDYGQGTPKISLQAASLFSLERYGEKNEERLHGYYYAKLNFETDKLKVWPRKAEIVNGAGGWRMRPETGSLPEDETESGEINFPTNAKKKVTKL